MSEKIIPKGTVIPTKIPDLVMIYDEDYNPNIAQDKLPYRLHSTKLPQDLNDYLNGATKTCFNCHKKKYIYKKIIRNHPKWKVPVTYLFCWTCRNRDPYEDIQFN